MATYQTYTAVGQKEDLADAIYNISPTDTPLMSTIGKTKATAVYHEWQLDSLAAVNGSNAAVEGAAASDATLSPSTRAGNRTQISQKTVKVSGTLDAVNKAGRKSEKAYQLAKAAAEVKRDMEYILCSNQIASAGSASAARNLGGLQAWLASNTSLGSTGVAGASGTTARTAGTDRTFTEAMLKTVVKSAFTAGGAPSVVLMTPTQKQTASGFSGIATRYQDVASKKQAQIVGAADVYVSDFGVLSLVPSRFIPADSGGGDVSLVIDPELLAVAYLRPFETNELAKTGDADVTQLLVEYTLEVRNEAAHGLVADLS